MKLWFVCWLGWKYFWIGVLSVDGPMRIMRQTMIGLGPVRLDIWR